MAQDSQITFCKNNACLKLHLFSCYLFSIS